MQTTSHELINDLLARVGKAADTVSNFRKLSKEEMNARKTASDWSLLECIEHLNIYGNFYLAEIESRLLANKRMPASADFKSGIIGNYFANLVQVKKGKLKKMKTPGVMDPLHTELSITTIERFLKQLDMLRSLLEQAKQTDLVKVKTSISLTKLIRLRLGDTFRFLVYHIERHVLQAQRTQADVKVSSTGTVT